MSNQIVISSGAKVRSLEGVLTGTAGIVNSVPLGGANGVATLDSSGKVPLSQLPASVITYLGTWNAATNTPTLTNGVGDVGDLYICNVAGTVNFGAGPITFAVGDWVIYSGTTWEKSGGASGTVTSVAMTVPTGLSVTGSPITTSGTLAVDLASGYTIPTTSFLSGLVPYTGAAQTVDLGSYDLNARGIKINGTGGSGHADFKHQSGTPTGSASSSTLYADTNGDMAWKNDHSYTTTLIGSGHTANRNYTLPNADGTLALTSDIPSLTGYVPYTGATNSLYMGSSYLVSAKSFITSGTSGNGYLKLLNSLVAATPEADGVKLSSVGSVDLVISSNTYNSTLITSGNTANRTYTFPNASGTIALTSDIPSLTNYVTLNGAQTITGIKTFTNEQLFGNGLTMTGGYITYTSGSYNLTLNTNILTANRNVFLQDKAGTIALTSDIPSLSGTAPISYSAGVISISQATTSTNGYLSSTDWNTFNNKQSALTNPVTGTGTSSYHAKFTGTSTIGNSMLTDDGTTLQSIGATRSNLYLKAASSSYYSQLAFTNGSNGSFGGISYNNSGQYMQFEANSSEWMRLTSDGKLGIGTTSPLSTLQVVGTGTALRVGESSGTTGKQLLFSIDAADGHSEIASIWQGTSATNLALNPSGGNVGVGISTPADKFQIKLASSKNVFARLGANNLPSIGFLNDNASSYVAGEINFSSLALMGGNVGIGTTTFNYSSSGRGYLAVSGTSNAIIEMQNNGAAAGYLYAPSGNLELAAVGSTRYLTFTTNDTERLRITSGGTLGINIVPPSNDSVVYIKGRTSGGDGYGLVVQNSSGSNMFFVRNDLAAFIPGVYSFTTGSAANVVVFSDGSMQRSTSSIKYKKNVKDYTKGLAEVMQLRPVSYEGISNVDEGKTFAGLIAEEVHELGLTEFVQYAEDGSPDALAYQNMIALAFKAIQELKAEIDELKNK